MIMSLSLKYLGSLSLAVILGVVCGCWSRTYQLHAPIEEGPRSSVTAAAPATIAGEVTIKTRAGEVRSGADSTIYLIPATAYASEWFAHYVVNGEKIEGTDPRSFPSARAGPVDREGRFEFRHVPAGAYYLTCNVHYRRSMFRIGRFNFGPRTLESVETYADVSIGAEQKIDIKVTRPPA
jgi:hypothetical protein